MVFTNAIFCIQNVAVIELSYYEANYGGFSQSPYLLQFFVTKLITIKK